MCICKVCGGQAEAAFAHCVLGKYQAEYVKCSECGFLYAVDPYWLEEAYRSPITAGDTGLLARNIDYSRKIAVFLYHFISPAGRYLDFAGGYGVFSRLMRDAGFEFYYQDPFTENLFAKTLEWNDKNGCALDAVTCFECLEHFSDPVSQIKEIVSLADCAIFSTELLKKDIPPETWPYYGFEHGQHISFYSEKTLSILANNFGLRVLSIGNLHFFSKEPLPENQLKRLMRKADRVWFSIPFRSPYKGVIRKMKKLNRVDHI